MADSVAKGLMIVLLTGLLIGACGGEQEDAAARTAVQSGSHHAAGDSVPTDARAGLPAALTGVVRSEREGPMEGVLVTVRRGGASFAITVVSDADGRYAFPQRRLEPGEYSVGIRAAGYELLPPKTASITGQSTTTLDLELERLDHYAHQLSNGEWLLSMPGTTGDKQQFLGCISCHTLERIVRSRHDAATFARVVNRMSIWAQGSIPERPQMRPDSVGRDAMAEEPDARARKLGEFASRINLSATPNWSYVLKTLPRPTGSGTRVIMTEYDLPRPETLPHDAIVDSDGSVWYGDFGAQYLGRLDPQTGRAVEYEIPVTKPEAPHGFLDMNFDPAGNIFLGMMYQGVIMRFNRDDASFDYWKSPLFDQGDAARTAMVTPARLDVDGRLWVGGVEEFQVDLNTGTWTAIDYTRGVPDEQREAASRIGSYGVAVDSKNNFYGLQLRGDYVTRVDAGTLVATPFRTPTEDSGPRRGRMDSSDRLWFGEYRGNRIGMFDTRAETFKEWEIPMPWTNPYDVVLDSDGYAWAGGMTNDYVARLDTDTNEMTLYLLPGPTNIRRVDVDNSTEPPSFWVGDNLGGTLTRVEPLD